MNGCLIIGTLDGANVEIRDCVGADNFFLCGAQRACSSLAKSLTRSRRFGALAEDISRLREERGAGKFVPDPRFTETLDYIKTGVFGDFSELLSSLEGDSGFGRGDYFLVGADFPSYIEAQEAVDKAYKDQAKWTKMSIMNTAGSGFFSSDRTIKQCVAPCDVASTTHNKCSSPQVRD